jgi:hypothetical protein
LNNLSDPGINWPLLAAVAHCCPSAVAIIVVDVAANAAMMILHEFIFVSFLSLRLRIPRGNLRSNDVKGNFYGETTSV